MNEIFTSGTWKANPGSEDAFVEAWTEFATWASTKPGVGGLHLLRNLDEPNRFLSFADWKTPADVASWKSAPDFRERLAHVLQHVAEFSAADFGAIAGAAAGAPTASPVRA
jgi:heme-degrading monooxygenase HmoA